MNDQGSDWREALKTEQGFRKFIINYFKKHKELKGTYDIPSYYEHYTVHLDSRNGITIELITGVTTSDFQQSAPLPFKQKEMMSIEDFRKLILHKKFADSIMSLADVFKSVAGVPNASDDFDD